MAELKQGQNEGVQCLINVSGIDLHVLYGSEIPNDIVINQLFFKDIYSESRVVADTGHCDGISIDEYLKLGTERDRLALLAAVKALLEMLNQRTPTWVFCHRGISRSPLVVACALHVFFQLSVS